MKSILKHSEDLTRLARYTRQFLRKRKNGKLWSDYLASHAVRKLQIGCGNNRPSGWLNADTHGDTFHLDATESFPFPANTFQFVLCEHMIEHIHFNNALEMLKECYRTMKRSGRIRISTPDLAIYGQMLSTTDPALKKSIDHIFFDWVSPGFYAARDYRPIDTQNRGVFALNDVFRNYEHKFIYDESTLRSAMQKVGFSNIVRYACGESDTPEFKGIETHTSPHDVRMTLTLEGVKA